MDGECNYRRDSGIGQSSWGPTDTQQGAGARVHPQRDNVQNDKSILLPILLSQANLQTLNMGQNDTSTHYNNHPLILDDKIYKWKKWAIFKYWW